MPADALLFDLGGVLVELDWDAMFARWARAGGADPELLRRRFTFDEAYERHERGEIDSRAYFDALGRRLGVTMPHEDWHAGWGSIFPRAIAPVVDLVRQVEGRVPLYLFSNTNVAHYEVWSRDFAAALRPFRRVFTSCSLGRRKPDREAFHDIAREIGVRPERILFFDDTRENVEGARAAGLQAVHVRSPDDVRRALAPWLVNFGSVPK